MRRKTEKRHILCLVILLVCGILPGYFYRYGLIRAWEGLRDLGQCIAYYCKRLLWIDCAPPKVTEYSTVKLREWLPFDAAELGRKMQAVWAQLIRRENIRAFFDHSAEIARMASLVLSSLTVILICTMLIVYRMIFHESSETGQGKALQKYLASVRPKLQRAVTWCRNFADFVKAHKRYWIPFVALWATYLCLTAIALEAVALYFYFFAAFDFAALPKQFVKLLADLLLMLRGLPAVVWICVALWIRDRIGRWIGFRRLNRLEQDNCTQIRSLPLVVMFCGGMRTGKTTALCNSALSASAMQRYDAFALLKECALKFPHFPFVAFEDWLRAGMTDLTVINLATCRKAVRKQEAIYQAAPAPEACFGYDGATYPMMYEAGLYVETVFDMLEVYAQAFFIYILHTSLIVGNLSIREDCVPDDRGHFPYWDTDYFHRDPWKIPEQSRYAHILDFDWLRICRRLVEDPKIRSTFEFGVLVVTEIAKERGNNLELHELKKLSVDTNQKNDGFNKWLKMAGHNAMVANICFLKVICDEQRPTSWGADARELCDVLTILHKSDVKIVNPCGHLRAAFASWILEKYQALYFDFRHLRDDEPLYLYAAQDLMARIARRLSRRQNIYGVYVQTMARQKGTMDGETEEIQMYLSRKKVYADRFASACFRDFFAKVAEKAQIGLEDSATYAATSPTLAELQKQNSYFVCDLTTIFYEGDRGK